MSNICKSCGTEHDSNFCPECGAPAHAPCPPDPPRRRGYGAVLVIIGILIGFIVGIGVCMVYGVSLGLLSFEGGLPAIVIQKTIPASTPTPPLSDPATSIVSTTPIISSSTSFPFTNMGDYSVSIVGLSQIKDYDGNDSIEIILDITNNSDHIITATTSLSVKSFQSGIELIQCSALSPDTPDDDLSSVIREFKPGSTLRCHYYFVLRDTSEPVDVEIRDIFGNVDPVSATLNLP